MAELVGAAHESLKEKINVEEKLGKIPKLKPNEHEVNYTCRPNMNKEGMYENLEVNL